MEYPFAFWQYAPNDCANIPTADSSIAAMATHLQQQATLNYFNKSFSIAFRPFFVQAYNELGYYGYKGEHLADLLENSDHSPMDFAPLDTRRTYTPTKMQDITDWLTTIGEQIIYIYGGVDPYTSTGITPNESLSSFTLIQPGASHGVRISHLDEKARVVTALEQWLEIDISAQQVGNAAKAKADPDTLRVRLK
jgi:hypothetical protein